MTPVAKWFKSAGERLFGRYYEGPDTPDVVLAEVDRFVREHPKAGRVAWITFARSAIDNAYREGWTRGYEHAERDPDQFRQLPVEMEANARGEKWWLTPTNLEFDIPVEFEEENVEPARMPLDPEQEPDDFSKLVARMSQDIDKKAKLQQERTAALAVRKRHREGHD